jgi:hypothetical protein
MKRTPGLITATAVTALALAGCSSGPPPVTAHGELTVYNNPFGGESMSEAYPDVTDGSQVTVTDSSGKVIGTGTLSYSKADTFSSSSRQRSSTRRSGRALPRTSPCTGSPSRIFLEAFPGTASPWARGEGPSG